MPHGVSISFPDLQPHSVPRPPQRGNCKAPRAPKGTQIAKGMPGTICYSSSLREEFRCALSDTLELQILLKVPLHSTDSPEFPGFLPTLLFSPLHGAPFTTWLQWHPSSHTGVNDFFISNSGGKLRVLLWLSKQLQGWRS